MDCDMMVLLFIFLCQAVYFEGGWVLGGIMFIVRNRHATKYTKQEQTPS